MIRIAAVKDGEYGISRFVSTDSVFANDTAIGNDEAGFYVGDSPWRTLSSGTAGV